MSEGTSPGSAGLWPAAGGTPALSNDDVWIILQNLLNSDAERREDRERW
jgi:hypothetical protein